MRVFFGRAAAFSLILSCSGCSFLFVKGKPANTEAFPPSEAVECTTSKAAPVLDTVFAGLELARTGYAVSLDDSKYRGQTLSRGADIGLGIGFAALFVSSAIYGYVKTGDCVDAKTQHDRARAPYLTPVEPAPLPPSVAASAVPQGTPRSAPPPPAQLPDPLPAPVPSPPPTSSVPSNAFPPAP